MRRIVTAFLLLFALVQSASAHPVPFSFLDVLLSRDGLEASLVLHYFDILHDLGIAPVERLHDTGFLQERSAAIYALIRNRLQILADGKPLTATFGPPEVLAERQAIRVLLHFPGVRVPAKLG